MKISKIRMLFLAILSTFVFMMANAQTCDWTVKNESDCEPDLAIAQNCNGNKTFGNMTSIGAGSWANPTTTIIYSQPCNLNCDIKVKIENPNNPVALYGDGDEFCCAGVSDCTPNNCVTVKIDKTNHIISLTMPDRCK